VVTAGTSEVPLPSGPAGATATPGTSHARSAALTEQTRTCPSCAAVNRPTRELCASCGAGLDDGVVPPRPVLGESPDPPRVARRRRSHRRWILPLLGGAALVAVLVLALTFAGLGPFAVEPAVPAADFDQGSYAADPEPLTLSNIATRTVSPDADAEAAVAMADGDPTTAWRSSGEVDPDRDVLDTIDLVLDGPAWIERIELANGDHLDREAYDASSPLREVRITFDGGVVVLAELLDIGLRRQAVTLPEPALTTEVRIDVLERVAGPSDQLAVSELTPVGWSAGDEDAELAARRAEVEPATGPTGPTLPLSSRRGSLP
jgi:hypothetical protein